MPTLTPVSAPLNVPSGSEIYAIIRALETINCLKFLSSCGFVIYPCGNIIHKIPPSINRFNALSINNFPSCLYPY